MTGAPGEMTFGIIPISMKYQSTSAVTITDQKTRVWSERAFSGSCPPFQGVDEPLRSAMISRSGDNHLLRFQMNEEQGEKSPLAVIRPHFRREEVPRPRHFLESLQEIVPRYSFHGFVRVPIAHVVEHVVDLKCGNSVEVLFHFLPYLRFFPTRMIDHNGTQDILL